MTRRTRPLVRLVTTGMRILLLALLLAGCATTVAGAGRSAPPPAPAGQVVFQVQPEIGGLAPQTLFRIARPTLTVYGDGTAFSADVPRNYAAPWAFRRGHVDRAALAALVTRAEASGLFAHADYGVPQITDTGTTSVLFHAGGRAARTAEPYALSVEEVDDQLTVTQRAHRVALRSLLRDIAAAVGPLQDWSPTRVEVIAATGRPTSDDHPSPWPGPDPDALLTQPSWRGRCGVVTGQAGAHLFDVARAHGTQFWTVGGATRLLLVRALLPGEATCPR